MFTRKWLTDTLRQLQQQDGNQIEPHLVIARSDWRWNDSDLAPCDSGGLPSLEPGTHGECRIPTDDGRDGLHVEMDKDVVNIHLDRVCARREPVRHGIDATAVVAGLVLGLLVGGVAAAVTGKPIVALAGVGLGGAIGAVTPRRANRYYRILSDWRVELLDASSRQHAGRLVVDRGVA